MKQEILVKLKSAEDETKKRIEAAKDRAAETLKAARARGDEIRRQAHDDARRDQEAQLQAERAHLAGDREKTLADGKKREEKLRAAYKANAEPFVKKAVEAFARSLDA